MLKSIEEIAEQQKRKANKVLFLDSFFYSLWATPFEPMTAKYYMRKHPYLGWEAFKANAQYIIPLSLWVCYDLKSILAFPLCIAAGTTFYYMRLRRDPKYNIHNIDRQFYKAAKDKAKKRQEIMRVLWWKYTTLARDIDSLGGIERLLDAELEQLNKRS